MAMTLGDGDSSSTPASAPDDRGRGRSDATSKECRGSRMEVVPGMTMTVRCPECTKEVEATAYAHPDGQPHHMLAVHERYWTGAEILADARANADVLEGWEPEKALADLRDDDEPSRSERPPKPNLRQARSLLRTHLVVKTDPIEAGRLRRLVGQALCDPRRRVWKRVRHTRLVDKDELCQKCVSIAERLGLEFPRPLGPQSWVLLAGGTAVAVSAGLALALYRERKDRKNLARARASFLACLEQRLASLGPDHGGTGHRWVRTEHGAYRCLRCGAEGIDHTGGPPVADLPCVGSSGVTRLENPISFIKDEGSWSWCTKCMGVTRGRCMCTMRQDGIDTSECVAHHGGVHVAYCSCKPTAIVPRDTRTFREVLHDARDAALANPLRLAALAECVRDAIALAERGDADGLRWVRDRFSEYEQEVRLRAAGRDEPARSHHLIWNGTEWVDDRCGCRYHPDDDRGTHGGAPHVHLCERHAATTRSPRERDPWLAAADALLGSSLPTRDREAVDMRGDKKESIDPARIIERMPGKRKVSIGEHVSILRNVDDWDTLVNGMVVILLDEAEPEAPKSPTAERPHRPTHRGRVFDLDDLVRRAVTYPPTTCRKAPRWSLVKSVFGLGNGSARDLCRRFGLDPDEMLGWGEVDDDE